MSGNDLPVYTVDVDDGNHLTECYNQQRNGTCKVIEKSQPVVSWSEGKYESQTEGDEAGHAWKRTHVTLCWYVSKLGQNISLHLLAIFYTCVSKPLTMEMSPATPK